MTNKKKIVILCVIGILIIITLTLGITYAFMKPKVENKNESTNISINSCAKVQLKDTNSQAIDLKNTYPMDDEKGLETDAYEFTISSTCEDYVGFDLYLTSLTTNEIDDKALKFAITNISGDVLATNILTNTTVASGDFNAQELEQLDLGINGTHKNIYKVFTNNIPLKGESTYKLYLWIDKDFADNTTMNKKMTVGVSIKSFSRVETMAEYLIANKNETLIYHDGLPDYEGMENANLEASDLSYRYTSTSTSNVVNNYICFGGECSNNPNDSGYKYLYRIIGLFKNDLNLYELKLIKADYVTKEETGEQGEYIGNYSYANTNYLGDKNEYFSNIASFAWNSKTEENEWSQSELNTVNLNDYYLNEFLGQGQNINVDPNKWQQMLSKHKWIVGGNTWQNIGKTYSKIAYQNEIVNPAKTTKYDDYIGLFYISDYYYAVNSKYWQRVGNGGANGNDYRTIKSQNWFYMGLNEWGITRVESGGIHHINMGGWPGQVASSGQEGYENQAIRPVFYLKADVKKASNSGNGTALSPYIINQ